MNHPVGMIETGDFLAFGGGWKWLVRAGSRDLVVIFEFGHPRAARAQPISNWYHFER